MLARIAVGLTCMQAALGWAAPADSLSEMDYFAEQPVVLSASRLSQPANRAPAAVTVITREMIEATGFRHLVDVLRLVPGFVVGWAGGNMPVATYVGLSNEFPHWMQIMVDGRSVYNPAYGHTTWRGIPLTLDDVDRIEVVRGPNAANDGLNSMLGTVHIYTRHSSTTPGGMLEVAAGEQDYLEGNVRFGAETSQGSWRLGLLGREDARHGVPHDHATDLQLSFRGDFQPTLQDDVMLELGTSRNFWQGTNVGQLKVEGQHAYYLSGYANLQWKRMTASGREWSLQMHHTFNQNDEDILATLNGNYRTTGSGIQLGYLEQHAAAWRSSMAGEYRVNRVHLPAMLGSNEYIEDSILRVSGALEWNPSPAWVLHAAAMVEHHSDTDAAYLSPRLAVNWLPVPSHAFRLGYSQALSALGIYANNTDIRIGGDQLYLSTGELDAEKIDSAEIGYLFHLPGRALNLDVRAYHNRIHDIVDTENVLPGDARYAAAPDGDGWKTYINHPEVMQRGLEYQLRWQPAAGRLLMLSQSWQRTHSDDGAFYARSVPQRTLSVLAAHPVAGIDVSVGYYRSARMRWIGGKIDSRYDRLDLRLARDWKRADGRIQAALVLQSLNGDEEESLSGFLYRNQRHDRRAYASLKYEFR